MPRTVDRDQQLVVSHRIDFIGQPSVSRTVSWDYKGRRRNVTRPDDGLPAAQWQVKCDVCDADLNFVVHSVQETRRRQAHRRAWAWAGLAVLILSAAGCLIFRGGASSYLAPLAVLGALVGYYAGLLAAAEIGITGHGAGLPMNVKHAVFLVEPHPAGLHGLVCDKCGHHEGYAVGSGYRKSFLDQEYQAATTRMEAHAGECGEGQETA
jgi:hypothetical protein